MKLKAGALTYALFIGVVTAILCFLMILLIQFNRHFFYRTDLKEKVLDNCFSGLALGLSLEEGDHTGWMDLFGAQADSVKIRKSPLGLYQMIAVEAKAGPYRAHKAALFGFSSAASAHTALYAAEKANALRFAGDALVKGQAWLPGKGVETAYIEGKNYTRDKKIYGEIKNSKKSIPAIANHLLANGRERLRQMALEGDSLVSYGDLLKMQYRPFYKRSLLANSTGNVQIEEKLGGNVVVKSSGEVMVKGGAELTNVTLVAPVIRIKASFRGKAHLIASDSIVVEEGAHLQYPSSALLIRSDGASEGQIWIKSGARFDGVAYYHSDSYRSKNQACIKIEENALVQGQLVANKTIEHRGTLHGTLIASDLILITPSGVYQSHLLDGRIERAKLIPDFGGLPFESWENKPELIMWL